MPPCTQDHHVLQLQRHTGRLAGNLNYELIAPFAYRQGTPLSHLAF